MKKTDIGAISRPFMEELLFHALRSIYFFERAEIQQFGLTYQQIFLMKILKRKSPLRISDSAEELRIPAFAATRLINQLEEDGHVTKNRDSADRRNIFISMTRSGEETLERIESHLVSMIVERLGGYTDREIGVILGLVKDLDFILGVESAAMDSRAEASGKKRD